MDTDTAGVVCRGESSVFVSARSKKMDKVGKWDVIRRIVDRIITGAFGVAERCRSGFVLAVSGKKPLRHAFVALHGC